MKLRKISCTRSTIRAQRDLEGESAQRSHEEHVAANEFSSVFHDGLVHEAITMQIGQINAAFNKKFNALQKPTTGHFKEFKANAIVIFFFCVMNGCM